MKCLYGVYVIVTAPDLCGRTGQYPWRSAGHHVLAEAAHKAQQLAYR